MKKTPKILLLILSLLCLGILSFTIYQNYKNNNYDDEKATEVWEERQESYNKTKDSIQK